MTLRVLLAASALCGANGFATVPDDVLDLDPAASVDGPAALADGDANAAGGGGRRLQQQQQGSEPYYRVITELCPYAQGQSPEEPPRFEGWSEDGQFEATAVHYLPDHDIALLNNPDNPSGIHWDAYPGWYSFDAGTPAAMTKFEYQCSGDCPGFIIQYSDGAGQTPH